MSSTYQRKPIGSLRIEDGHIVSTHPVYPHEGDWLMEIAAPEGERRWARFTAEELHALAQEKPS